MDMNRTLKLNMTTMITLLAIKILRDVKNIMNMIKKEIRYTIKMIDMKNGENMMIKTI